jgi:hypothetical protein
MSKRKVVTYLQHRCYGQVGIIAARVTSTENRCLLVDVGGKEKLLLADSMYWSENAATVTEVFQDFLACAAKIEAALRLKAAKLENSADTRKEERLIEVDTEQEDEATFAYA